MGLGLTFMDHYAWRPSSGISIWAPEQHVTLLLKASQRMPCNKNAGLEGMKSTTLRACHFLGNYWAAERTRFRCTGAAIGRVASGSKNAGRMDASKASSGAGRSASAP